MDVVLTRRVMGSGLPLTRNGTLTLWQTGTSHRQRFSSQSSPASLKHTGRPPQVIRCRTRDRPLLPDALAGKKPLVLVDAVATPRSGKTLVFLRQAPDEVVGLPRCEDGARVR
ncbi:hypothetical protein FIBSPDRAFT_849551, partial [Athelia psychrophila]